MTLSGFTPVTHVIFDLDGLLLDTEPIYTLANEKTLAKYGKQFTWDIKKGQMGMRNMEAIAYLLDCTGLSSTVSVDEYADGYIQLLDELLPEAQLLPDAERLVRHLHSHDIPIAICTGSGSRDYRLKTSNHTDLFLLFSHAVTSSDDAEVSVGKPAPDCYLVCARRFEQPPTDTKHVLVFEDAPNGVVSAVAANMQVVMVPDARVDANDRQLATHVLSSLCDFDPSLFNLPPYL